MALVEEFFQEELAPAAHETVILRMEGGTAVSLIEMLNMNNIHNRRGNRVTFALQCYGDEWVIVTTEHTG